MTIWDMFFGLWMFMVVMVVVCAFILTHESGSQRYKHGRDYPYYQDLDW